MMVGLVLTGVIEVDSCELSILTTGGGRPLSTSSDSCYIDMLGMGFHTNSFIHSSGLHFQKKLIHFCSL